ncbi:uncharacterized protein CLUP02_01066 [Colletotrichum lupini]|uniref:Uncharacterized protein n=1 Tax=Colletotrichum lupini TaxID=145971 RepID=A0A9Q8SC08_9PEZI|nr:uncharacterized protein CLUP02_01066 [Colletotrichum lupini]UQC74415.1 hypothetical protein CLUP02_01066 [Colletotrichum lupini]
MPFKKLGPSAGWDELCGLSLNLKALQGKSVSNKVRQGKVDNAWQSIFAVRQADTSRRGSPRSTKVCPAQPGQVVAVPMTLGRAKVGLLPAPGTAGPNFSVAHHLPQTRDVTRPPASQKSAVDPPSALPQIPNDT